MHITTIKKTSKKLQIETIILTTDLDPSTNQSIQKELESYIKEIETNTSSGLLRVIKQWESKLAIPSTKLSERPSRLTLIKMCMQLKRQNLEISHNRQNKYNNSKASRSRR
jgi:hypothetical protein